MTALHPDLPRDAALLDAFLRDGDESALVLVVGRLTPRLYQAARALTGWRVLGAQTVVEQAWRSVLTRPEELDRDDDGALELTLLGEITRRALAAGDSPRPDPDADADPERAAAMRAVALLPLQERTVYVLHDVAGMSVDGVAGLLDRPAARVRAELWHARLAVTTLLGIEVPAETEDDDTANPGAPVPIELWDEPTPRELIRRIEEDAHRRRGLMATRPGRRRGGPVLGMVAAAFLLGGAGLAAVRARLAPTPAVTAAVQPSSAAEETADLRG